MALVAQHEPYIRLKDGAEFLGIERGTLYGWLKTGRIPHRKIGKGKTGGTILLRKSDLVAWVEKNEGQ
jgi:excisionase family DNA binding protein